MLMREIRINRVRKRKCIIIKHSNDDERGGVNCIKTKYGLTDSGHSTATLKDKRDLVKDCNVIGIDEGQFFGDLVEMCIQWANEGKIVVVAALNGDYLMEPFDQVSKLIPRCENVEMLKAICAHCQNSASFTRRLVELGNVQNVPGGFDIYSPVCRKCYHMLTPSM
jgi:thymidine kinase